VFAVIELTRTGSADHVATVLLNSLAVSAEAGDGLHCGDQSMVTFARGETFKRILISNHRRHDRRARRNVPRSTLLLPLGRRRPSTGRHDSNDPRVYDPQGKNQSALH
jgi:hypothetical protein